MQSHDSTTVIISSRTSHPWSACCASASECATCLPVLRLRATHAGDRGPRARLWRDVPTPHTPHPAPYPALECCVQLQLSRLPTLFRPAFQTLMVCLILVQCVFPPDTTHCPAWLRLQCVQGDTCRATPIFVRAGAARDDMERHGVSARGRQ